MLKKVLPWALCRDWAADLLLIPHYVKDFFLKHFAYIPYRNDGGDEHFLPLHPRTDKITMFQGVNAPFTQKSHVKKKKKPPKTSYRRDCLLVSPYS